MKNSSPNRFHLCKTACVACLLLVISSKGLAQFTPSDLPGLLLWLDAADVNDGGNPADNSAVSTWHDKSGGNHDLQQGNGGDMPLYLVNALTRGDGVQMPVLRFDSDWLANGDIRGTIGNVHAFVVSRRSTAQLGGDTYQRLISTSDGADALDYGAPDWTMTSPYDSSGLSLEYSTEIRQFKTSVPDRKIAGIHIARNAATGASRLRGDIAEVLIYDAVLTGEDLTNILAYLDSKWITGVVPEGPYFTSIGSSAITSHTAELAATLADGNGTVHVCWDTIDQGTDLLSWTNRYTYTDVTSGNLIEALVTDLPDSTIIWYRFCIEDAGSGSTNWSNAYSFKTRGPVGAIRWDAWIGDSTNVGLAVETALGPQQYHYRLPFYGVEISDTEVDVVATTQAVIDKEIAFAKAAGLDYWAYVTYDEVTQLSIARQLHQASANTMDMNFCLIHEGGRVGEGGMAEWPTRIQRYLAFFQEANYQTVLDGRPLFFCLNPQNMIGAGKFADWNEAATAITQLRTAVTNAGLPTPYLVIMGWAASDAKTYMDNLGFDAISQYAVNGSHVAAPYSTLTGLAESWWTSAKNTGAHVLPLATAGWDRRPRVENPVPWETYQVPGEGIDLYYERPTPAQLGAHVQTARDWCTSYPAAAETDAILIYAWNEIDEGGWIVPTLLDKAAHLEAVQQVLTPIADSDTDYMPDLWETWYFDSPVGASVDTDLDKDGSFDPDEYEADTDPTDNASRLAITGINMIGGEARIQWTGGLEARQILETRTDLLSPSEDWAPLQTLEPPTPVTNEFIDTNTIDTSRFYRVRAERP